MHRLKRLLKWAAVAFAVFVIGLLLAPLGLSSHAHVERTLDIAASPEDVFAILSDFGQTAQWDPWVERDPGVRTTIRGSGLGAEYEWEGTTSGAGRSRIVALDRPRRVQVHIQMRQPMADEFLAEFRLAPAGRGTRVTWMFDQDLSYFQRYVGLFLDNLLGAAFERGLDNLKRYVERLRATPQP